MPSIDDVKNYLAGHQVDVWEYEQPTPTCETAAAAVGCTPAEIAKTLLFLVGGKPAVVVTCGDMKVKSSLLKKAAGLSGKVKLPQAEDVLEYTGYAPGGVCPFLLRADLPVLLDTSMQRFEKVYAAAGNDYSAVPVTFAQLEQLTGGKPVEVCDPA
ncbi:Cys-tRNA(Pro) deacylase, prolyl-tRNA editing enzyme YbaK/EbsC [Malonomonas rubra DSM 5091]|uniref:Cys-tRNA(Pro) deacylase, prolyl-tRNA editing enzyme YbaK/EbsC n=1 Tax=Malonomonas rubra DSM 5091 TaxID=1122189 RepID=A0A1M6FJF3_MALRU|nr:YbaK/EbsC family protein [Malonomonas rubra]SHI97766.1 Cys-tRNA(Pro) deacylase, prolyl-tRNA editing enzyme YbaK/EbsC [Malonomonas rubra DSM 5091]